MAETTKKPTGGIDLGRLSQQEIAKLLGERPSWLRDTPAPIPRNADGSYDAAASVQAYVTHKLDEAKSSIADLPADLLEGVLQLAELAGSEVDPVAPVLAMLDRLEREYGAAGLAAVAVELRHHLRTELEAWGERSGSMSQWNGWQRDAVAAGKLVMRCKCGAYRWGRKWKREAPPAGYATQEYACPKCEAKS